MPMSVAEAKLLEGKILAAKVQEEIQRNVENFRSKGMDIPCLAALQPGQNPSSEWYINQQEKLAGRLGILFKKFSPAHLSSQTALKERIQQINGDAHCHGVFITMPLPPGFDADDILFHLEPHKDVEGVHPANLGLIVLRRAKLIPPTAYAALRLIEWAVRESHRELRGMKAVIVGQSAIVGRPLHLLLGERRVTTTVCNTGTSVEDLQNAVSTNDIVVACAGQPGLVRGNWIKPGAIVIDVGTTEVNGKLVGDVEFDEARKRAGLITPVPGGVGPLTVTMLMQNLIHAYQWQHQLTCA